METAVAGHYDITPFDPQEDALDICFFIALRERLKIAANCPYRGRVSRLLGSYSENPNDKPQKSIISALR